MGSCGRLYSWKQAHESGERDMGSTLESTGPRTFATVQRFRVRYYETRDGQQRTLKHGVRSQEPGMEANKGFLLQPNKPDDVQHVVDALERWERDMHLFLLFLLLFLSFRFVFLPFSKLRLPNCTRTQTAKHVHVAHGRHQDSVSMIHLSMMPKGSHTGQHDSHQRSRPYNSRRHR